MVNQDLGRVAVVARGAYDPAAEYERLDAVSYNGSSFLVRKHCQGVEPADGEYYMLMAQAGDSTAASAAAAEALAAAGRADTAARNADQNAAAAGAAADSANAAAAEATNVVNTVIPDVNKLKDDFEDVTNGVCRLLNDYQREATMGEQEPYVFKFYGKAGETYKFENKGIKVNIILVHTDNTRTTYSEVDTNGAVNVTLAKDCKSFGYYPYSDGVVKITVSGVNYQRIMTEASEILVQPSNLIADNTKYIKDMMLEYGFRPNEMDSESQTAQNYKLVDNGVCVYDNKYELRRYEVEKGQLVFIKSNERYQWQNARGVPTSNNTNLIGEQVVGNVNGLAIVPDGATYLIISSLKTGDNGKYTFEPKSSSLFSKSKYYKNDVFNNFYARNWFDGLDLAYDDFGETTTVEQFYSKMNELADNFSWRLSRENLGKDASGQYDIWGYVYKPFELPSASSKRPRIIITSCHHGFERGSAFVLYYLMWLFKNKKSNPAIRELANCVEIAFIPIVNPWGWSQYTPVNTDAETVGRNNSNGVDLNRKYNSDSLQPEQIIVKNFVDRYKDNAILFIDHHVNGGTRNTASSVGQRVWVSSESYECGDLVKKINSAYVNYFSCYGGDLYSGVNDALLATQTHGTDISSGYSTYVGDSNGIMSLTFEAVFKKSKTLEELENETEFNPAVNKLNTIAFVNLLNHYLVSLKDRFM